MRKIIISTVVVLLATFFYAYGKIDYDGIMNRWSGASLAELKADGNACLERGAIDSALVLYTMVTSRYDPDMDRDEQKLCAQAFNNAPTSTCSTLTTTLRLTSTCSRRST